MADYPAHLERRGRLADGRSVLIRPIRAGDERRARRFFDGLSDETKRLRFMGGDAPNAKLIRFFTRIDYDLHMAFVGEHDGRLVGDARYMANPGGTSCEFGIVIADDWRHSGLATLLMDALVDAARARGFRRIEGLVLRDNPNMLGFVRKAGFEAEGEPHEPTMVRVVKNLRSTSSV
ncbi:MAG TPA: GNAT family N-acetyltransferase [Burkholderiales bacterium]|jgi:acetyltransferase